MRSSSRGPRPAAPQPPRLAARGGRDHSPCSLRTTVGSHRAAPAHDFPHDLAADPDGSIWITVLGEEVGNLRLRGARPPERELFARSSEPRNLVIGFVGTGGLVREYSLPRAMLAPFGTVVGADGRIWFFDPGQEAIDLMRMPFGPMLEGEYR